MTLTEYAAPQASYTFSGVEPGLSEYAVEAWERMTYAGLNVRMWTIFYTDLRENNLVAC